MEEYLVCSKCNGRFTLSDLDEDNLEAYLGDPYFECPLCHEELYDGDYEFITE